MSNQDIGEEKESDSRGAVIEEVMYRCCQNIRINRLEAAASSAVHVDGKSPR